MASVSGRVRAPFAHAPWAGSLVGQATTHPRNSRSESRVGTRPFDARARSPLLLGQWPAHRPRSLWLPRACAIGPGWAQDPASLGRVDRCSGDKVARWGRGHNRSGPAAPAPECRAPAAARPALARILSLRREAPLQPAAMPRSRASALSVLRQPRSGVEEVG